MATKGKLVNGIMKARIFLCLVDHEKWNMVDVVQVTLSIPNALILPLTYQNRW